MVTNNKMYRHCMMCDLVNIDGVRMKADDFRLAYPGVAYTTGVCEFDECLDRYCLEIVQDENLAELIRKNIESRR